MFKFRPATITTFPLELSAHWWTKIFRKLWVIGLITITPQASGSDAITKLQEQLRQIQNNTAVTTTQVEPANALVTTISNNPILLERLSPDQRERLRVDIRSTLLHAQKSHKIKTALSPAHAFYTDLADQLEPESIYEPSTGRFRTISTGSLTSPRSTSGQRLSSPTSDSKSPEPATTRTNRFSPWHSEVCFTLLEKPSASELIKKLDSTTYSSTNLSEIAQLAAKIKLSEIPLEELEALQKSLTDKLTRFEDFGFQKTLPTIDTLNKFKNQAAATLLSKCSPRS